MKLSKPILLQLVTVLLLIAAAYFIFRPYARYNFLDVMTNYYQYAGMSADAKFTAYLYSVFDNLNNYRNFWLILIILDVVSLIAVRNLKLFIMENLVVLSAYLLAALLQVHLPAYIALPLFALVYIAMIIWHYQSHSYNEGLTEAFAFIFIILLITFAYGLYRVDTVSLPKTLTVTKSFLLSDPFDKENGGVCFYKTYMKDIICSPSQGYQDFFKNYDLASFTLTINDPAIVQNLENGSDTLEVNTLSNNYSFTNSDFTVKNNQFTVRFNKTQPFGFFEMHVTVLNSSGQKILLNWSDDYTLILVHK